MMKKLLMMISRNSKVISYNQTKGGVDSLDQLVHSYKSKRKSSRWPLCFYRSLFDVAGVAAFVLWTFKHPNWKVGKSHKRRLPSKAHRLAC